MYFGGSKQYFYDRKSRPLPIIEQHGIADLTGCEAPAEKSVVIIILIMETIRFASLLDFEDYARRRLDKPTFEHLRGVERPADHLTDFFNVKLKLRGMANLKHFKGLNSHILVKEVKSPICVGPLPPISDVEIVSGAKVNHS